MVLIKQKKVSKIDSHIPQVLLNKRIVIAVNDSAVTQTQTLKSGLSFPLNVGERVLPSIIGKVSRVNTNGKEIVRRDLPKETLYRDMEFTRQQWCGNGQTEEVTDCVWIPYKRFPRDLELPHSVEVQVNRALNGQIFISSDPIIYNAANNDLIKHVVNLYLELYGTCIVYEEGTTPVQPIIVKRLNWNVLPKGQYPWAAFENQLKARLSYQRPKTFAATLDRFHKIHDLNPDFIAVGNNGYKGYLVFGFESKGLYVLESQNTNNAIYVFDRDWEQLSKLTKAEILSNSLQKARIIHNPDWLAKLKGALV